MELSIRLEALRCFLKDIDKDFIAIGFSGGVDSSFLLSACIRWSRVPVYALNVESIFLSDFARKTIEKNSRELEVKISKLYFDPLSIKEIRENGLNRCYFCKKNIYSRIIDFCRCRSKGKYLIFDGTQADDLKRFRPGIRALRELGIGTPLSDLGFTKGDIRKALRTWGYSFWNLPSESCLAAQIGYGIPLNELKLKKF